MVKILPFLGALGLLCLACTSADEKVESLASEELGAAVETKTGGFFSALMTSGSFMMMQAGAFEEEEEATSKETVMELGEEVAKGEPAEESSTTQMDWSQCQSEGGTKNCAVCEDSNGGLKCSHASGDSISDCKDDAIGINKKAWKPVTIDPLSGGWRGECGSFRDTEVMKGVTIINNVVHDSIYPDSESGGRDHIIIASKQYAGHPHMLNGNVGAIIFKRVVSHTRASDQKSVADVYKVGYCIKCPQITGSQTRGSIHAGYCRNGANECSVFSNIHATKTQEYERVNFVTWCAAAAFDKSGGLKPSYTCSESEAKPVQGLISSF